MDTVILDVVIGLILAYLVLALLVTKVQEMLVGQLGTSRKHTLHDMLDEALQRDAGLKAAMLQNPLISALYQGTNSGKGVLRAGGPSAIPSDLFTRVLLVEVFKDGKNNHPKERYESPLLFVQDLDTRTHAANEQVLGVLRALVAGRERSWPDYESAIAAWFDQVGERANGWFQRKALLWGLAVSIALAGLLNVNTFQLAERLAGDPDLRRSTLALAQRAVEEFGTRPASDSAAPPVRRPADRAYDALMTANQQLHTLFFKNSKYASFDPNRQALPAIGDEVATAVEACAQAGSPFADSKGKRNLLSNPETWEQLMPPMLAEVQALALPERFNTPKAQMPAASATWPQARTTPTAKPDATRQVISRTREDRLRALHGCLGGLVGWVDKAVGAQPGDAALASGVSAATKALRDASDALREMIEDAGSSLIVNRLYLRDPEAFESCARLPGMTRANLRACVSSATNGEISLPVGWTGRNIRETFCEVVEVAPGTATATATATTCGAASFKGHPGLGIQPLALQGPQAASIAAWLAGILVTAVFAALGAPFWFDLLGRFVKMRAAGTPPPPQERRADASAASPDAGGGAGGTPSGGPAAAEPFSDARNDFERTLTVADKMAVQTALHVTATGLLDEPTRRALVPRAKELGLSLANTDELSLLAFMKITDKLPSALSRFDDRTGSGAAQQAQGDLPTHVDALAAALCDAFGFRSRSTKERDEQRALAMLWLIRNPSAPGVPDLGSLSTLARDTRLGRNLQDWPADVAAPLLALTAAQLTPGSLKRAAAPWLDWALGELGQTQASRDRPEDSNPRVVAYLTAGQQRNVGDNTDWCGAFLAWVVTQYNAEASEHADLQLPPPPNEPARAVSWADWGEERTGDPQPGDVVVLYRDRRKDSFHVALLVELKPDGSLWLVGGNQDDPGCVSCGHRDRASVFKVRRPPTGAPAAAEPA